jgi:selenocysteine-specific elongation factor
MSRVIEIVERIAGALERYHHANPYTWGMAPNHACEFLGLETKSFERLAKYLSAGGTIAVKHGRLALKAFAPPVSAHLLGLRDQILAMVRTAGVNGPARGNLMKELKITEPDMQVLSRLLVEDGTVMVLDGNFILTAVYEECRKKLMELFAASASVELGAFRDAISANRKMAVAMLDAFDGEGLTRRIGDGRVLVKPAGKV